MLIKCSSPMQITQKNKKELTFFDFLLDEQHTHVASSRQHGTMALIRSDPRSERYHARAREKHAHMRARIYDIDHAHVRSHVKIRTLR